MTSINIEKVTDIHHWSEKTFSFKTTRKFLNEFKNGEFAMIGIEHEGKKLMRAYSFVSANYEDHLEFLSIKLQNGLLTSKLQNIEVGHTPASIRESLLEKVIRMGDKFVSAVKKEYPPGIIGPFSLQSVITKDLEIIVYDVSLRVPGNPILATTSPYTKYQYGQTFGIGRRIAMELKKAKEENQLNKIVT